MMLPHLGAALACSVMPTWLLTSWSQVTCIACSLCGVPCPHLPHGPGPAILLLYGKGARAHVGAVAAADAGELIHKDLQAW